MRVATFGGGSLVDLELQLQGSDAPRANPKVKPVRFSIEMAAAGAVQASSANDVRCCHFAVGRNKTDVLWSKYRKAARISSAGACRISNKAEA
jgi:hypothetical protein